METVIFIFQLIICVFEIWMLSDFFDSFLGGRSEKRKYRMGIVLVFSIIVFIINSLDNTVINIILVPTAYFILSIAAFKGNVYKKIFATLIGTAVILGTELIVVSVLNLTSKELIESSMVDEPSAVLLTVIVKMITFVIFAVIKQFISKGTENMDFVTFLLYMIAPLSGLGIMFSIVFCNIDFTKGSPAKYMLIVFFVLLMIGDAAVFYGYNRYARVQAEKEENSRMVVRQQMQLNNYRRIDVANRKYMTLLHDTNHHMKTVYSLLVKDKKDEAVAMLESLDDEYGRAEMIEYSSNIILNTILSDYKEKTENEHMECDIFVERGFNVDYVDEIDLVAMFGNLLSNAYEAALKTDERKIKVQMFMQNDGSFSVVKIQNSFDGMIKKEGEILKTTKEDEHLHGFGIKSVEEAAEKYNGWITSTWEDTYFKTVLVLENRMLD